MKQFIFSLVMLIGLAFSNVGYALPDVSTEKTQTEFITQADTPDVFGVYEMVKTQAPEVFTDDAGGTKVTLYGKYKDEAFKYLTEQKNAINIYTSGDCFKDKPIAVSICRSKIAYKSKDKTSYRHYTALSTSGQINSISKKWIRSI